jgi:hypothetical protein
MNVANILKIDDAQQLGSLVPRVRTVCERCVRPLATGRRRGCRRRSAGTGGQAFVSWLADSAMSTTNAHRIARMIAGDNARRLYRAECGAAMS